MGRYLKQGNESFEKSVNSEIYIDKIGLIKYTNRVLNTLQGYVCIRRPDEKIRKKVQENWDSLAKPLDGLGIFEKIFTQIGAVTGDESGAKSTDLQSPESAEHLCEKCKAYAKNWKPCADKLWAETKMPQHSYENYKK